MSSVPQGQTCVFSEGDEVRILDGHWKDRIATVTRVGQVAVYGKIDGETILPHEDGAGCWMFGRVEKVEPVFTVGDRVIALECEFFATNSDVVPAGSVGTVERVSAPYTIVKFDCHEDSWYTCSGEIAPEHEPEPEPTVKDLVDQAIDRVRDVRQAGKGATYEVADLPGGREFSLAITHLEDALMRFTRGMAMRLGVFAPADLEKIGTDPGAASKFLGDRDQKAADAAQCGACTNLTRPGISACASCPKRPKPAYGGMTNHGSEFSTEKAPF